VCLAAACAARVSSVHAAERCGFDSRDSPAYRAALRSAAGGSLAPGDLEADTAPSHYWGPKRVLVLRVDFSDLPGESVSAAQAQAVMDNEVKPFFERASFNQTTFVTTVSSRVYRMPRTAVAYATGTDSNDVGGTMFPTFHAEAAAVASADFAIATYDRIVVASASIGPERIAGSKFNWGGVADYSGIRVQINGGFFFPVVAHELGHTYGATHATLWRPATDNPIAATGTDDIYGDPYDIMGAGTTAEHHFSLYNKWLMGWLPSAAVRTVTASGTYRLYRFDDPAASTQPTLALRIFRDGSRSYWIGYRAGITTDPTVAEGAYVLWCPHDNNISYLLDLAPPYQRPDHVTLAPGVTLDDSPAGISFRVVGRGGAAPQQYIDVEITLSGPPASLVTAWGAMQSYQTTELAPVSNVAAVAAGAFHSLALRRDGTIWTGGLTNAFGEDRVPAGLNDAIAIAAGRYVSGAVRRDGTVVVWGDNSAGLGAPPAGLGGVRALAFGNRHALALRQDGTVVAWGSGSSSGEQIVPAGLSGVAAIAAGGSRSLALRRDGTVVAWGNAAFQMPAGLKDITAIACHDSVGLALKADGTVAVWGFNGSGQLDVPPGLSSVKAIAVGSAQCVAVRADGSVVSWGGIFGRSGNTVARFHDLLIETPTGLPPVSAVSAGALHTMALAGSLAAPIVATLVAQSSGGNVALSWGAVPGAVAYRLEVATDSTFSALLTGQMSRDLGNVTGTTLTGLASNATYFYRVTSVSASGDTAVSNVGRVAPEPSRLINLSVRNFAGVGDRTLIVGFAIDGTGPKPLLVRAAGPALAAFGVSGLMADPRVELYQGTTKLSENDNWSANDGRTLGAFAFTSGSLDAVLTTALGAGSYTVQVKGANDRTGNALVEVYDAQPAVSGAKLYNLSARTQVDPGTPVIGGFAIAGGTNKTVLIRVAGPGLNAFMAGAHPDPKLTLYGPSGKLQENDNWSGDDGRALGAFPFAPGSRDAALRVTLAPGTYSVWAESVGQTGGVVLVELYDVP
jgi:M6 family metalloprotease-like protein